MGGEKFLENRKYDGYVRHIEQLPIHFQRLFCDISFKFHYLQRHLGCHSKNIGGMSEEQGVRFHQGLWSPMEQTYQVTGT